MGELEEQKLAALQQGLDLVHPIRAETTLVHVPSPAHKT
jgi:hypothetical protein